MQLGYENFQEKNPSKRNLSVKIKKITLGILFFCFLSLAAHAGSPVWKVSLGRNHLYLGGTIHILGESDYPLPRAFDAAYDKSQILVFETDIQKSRDPEFQQLFLTKMVYPDNRTLKQLLQPKTFENFKIFTADRGIQVESMDRFKPGLVLMALTLNEVERLGLDGMGVDEFYFIKAGKGGKQMLYLESLEQQISFLETLGLGNEDQMIAYILKDLKTLPHLLTRIKKAWKTGDVPGLESLVLTPLNNDFPELFHSLMVQRNLRWLPRIEAMATTPQVEFVLVGAAHLAGDQGLLALLAAKGFFIENL